MKQKNYKAKILLLYIQRTVSAEQRIQGFLDTIQSDPAHQVVREKRPWLNGTTLPASRSFGDGLAFDTWLYLNDRAKPIGAPEVPSRKPISSADFYLAESMARYESFCSRRRMISKGRLPTLLLKWETGDASGWSMRTGKPSANNIRFQQR